MVTAFILITTKSGKEKKIRNTLLKIPEVKEAQVVYGDFDLVVKLEADSLDKLNNIVLSKIRKLSDISVTTTLISI